PFHGGKTRVIQADRNVGCYGRFLCAAQARNEVVYVQDDDALNSDLESLRRKFLEDPTRIAHALTPKHWDQRQRLIYGEAQVAILGWGALFKKDWLRVIDALPHDTRSSELFRREADKYFTLLLEQRHNSVRGDIAHLDGHSTHGTALWLDPRHPRFTALAI